jgi:hypothetical protein
MLVHAEHAIVISPEGVYMTEPFYADPESHSFLCAVTKVNSAGIYVRQEHDGRYRMFWKETPFA